MLWSFTWFWRIYILTISISLLWAIAQLCLTLQSTDCNPPGSSAHWIILGLILEWAAISPSRGSSQPRDQTHGSCSSCIGRQILYPWATLCYPVKGCAALQVKPQESSVLGSKHPIQNITSHIWVHGFKINLHSYIFSTCVLNYLT